MAKSFVVNRWYILLYAESPSHNFVNSNTFELICIYEDYEAVTDSPDEVQFSFRWAVESIERNFEIS